MIVLYSPDGSRVRICEPSEAERLLAGDEWVRANGVDIVFADDPIDGSPVEISRSLMTDLAVRALP
jgi:hypothetical protein